MKVEKFIIIPAPNDKIPDKEFVAKVAHQAYRDDLIDFLLGFNPIDLNPSESRRGLSEIEARFRGKTRIYPFIKNADDEPSVVNREWLTAPIRFVATLKESCCPDIVSWNCDYVVRDSEFPQGPRRVVNMSAKYEITLDKYECRFYKNFRK